MKEVRINFGGFYENEHYNRVNDALYDTDDNGNEKWIPLKEINAVRKHYSKIYVDFLNEYFKVEMEFSELDSPREQNFRTDYIWAKCSEEDMDKIIYAANQEYAEEFETAKKKFCTGRDGYAPNYSMDDIMKDDEKDILTRLALDTLIVEELNKEWEQYFDFNCVYDTIRL